MAYGFSERIQGGVEEMKAAIEINNAPAKIYGEWLVIRRADDNKLWYYGAYSDKDQAELIAQTIGNGFVIRRECE